MKSDLPWLAGIIDSESSFAINITVPKAGTRYVQRGLRWTPQIIWGLLESKVFQTKVESILLKHDIGFYKHHGTTNGRRGGNPFCVYFIHGSSIVVRLSRLLLPFLTIKAPHAKLFIRFFSHRLRLLTRGSDEKGFFRKVDWNAVENLAKMLDRIHSLNRDSCHVKWTGGRILQFYKDIEGERYPNIFIIDNPRRRQ